MQDQLIHIVRNLMTEGLKKQNPEAAFEKVYPLLPLAIRLLIKEDAFMKFCLENKEAILRKNSSATTS